MLFFFIFHWFSNDDALSSENIFHLTSPATSKVSLLKMPSLSMSPCFCIVMYNSDVWLLLIFFVAKSYSFSKICPNAISVMKWSLLPWARNHLNYFCLCILIVHETHLYYALYNIFLHICLLYLDYMVMNVLRTFNI